MSEVWGAEGVCVYCGEPSECIDHVIPYSHTSKSTTRKTQWRNRGPLAHACTSCNSILGDVYILSLAERAAFILARLERKRPPICANWTEEELAELDRSLSGPIRRQLAERAKWERRIAYLKVFSGSGELRDPEPGSESAA